MDYIIVGTAISLALGYGILKLIKRLRPKGKKSLGCACSTGACGGCPLNKN